MKLHFVTPTAVDLRELFTLGLGSKRGDNTKIGHKGSGLKFTLALLHRLGSALEVTVGGQTWQSCLKDVEIRGTVHQVIQLVCNETLARQETHITLSAGADTWLDPWFALRELLQNTLDEGGRVASSEHPPAAEGGTVMSIDLTPAIAEAWVAKTEWHHERRHGVMYQQGDGGLFYHGFRIYTNKAWSYCYDATTLLARDNLSEDRQARNVDWPEFFTCVLKGGQFPSDAYGLMLSSSPSEDIRHLMDVAYQHTCTGTPDFGSWKLSGLEDAFIAQHGERASFTTNASERERYFAGVAGYSLVEVGYRLASLLRHSKRVKPIEAVMPDAIGRLTPIAARAVPADTMARLKKALRITRSLRPAGCEVTVVECRLVGDNIGGVAFADVDANRVMILRSWADTADVSSLAEALVEEYVHISSKEGDCSAGFEKALIKTIVKCLTPKVRTEYAIT